MNNHGSIMLVVVYRVPGVGVIPETFATRRWVISHDHVHNATDDFDVFASVEDARWTINRKWPGAVSIGALESDPPNIVETWVVPWVSPLGAVRMPDARGVKATLDGLATMADASPDFDDINDPTGHLRGRLRRS